MRTISSRKFVGEAVPPKNLSSAVGFGKIPAFTRDAALALIMHDGIVLPGNCVPCTIPAGATPPGQFAKRTLGATCAMVGTLMFVVPKLAPAAVGYVAGSGTNCPLE